MKKLFVLVLCIALCTFQSFATSGYYAEYKMSSSGSSSSLNGVMKLYSNGSGNSRSEVNMVIPNSPVSNMNVVALHKQSEPNMMYMIFDATKTYSKTDISKYNGGSTDQSNYEIKVIGAEKVNGYTSTHFKILKDGKELEDLWTSKEVPGYKGFDMSSSKYVPSGKLADEIRSKGLEGMMVRILVDEKGTKMQIDLVKMEQKELAASLFSIPADYKETDMINGMMKEMNMPTMDELMKMTPEERDRWMKEMEKKYK